MKNKDDIIAAVATPPGTGGVAIVRISGKGAADLLPDMFSAKRPFEHAKMRYGTVLAGGRPVDSGYAVVFYSPHSYTGEDTVELHVHGGPVTCGLVLNAAIEAGARPAEPGEFTKRAFLNGKMDLSQAQAVGDLIGALSEAGARLALRQTREDLRECLKGIADLLLDTAARIEAVLEYPDEDIPEEPEDVQGDVVRAMADKLRHLAGTTDAGRAIRDGLRTALAGAPNTGKSSLFNRLCRENVAIVTDVAGTTRDCLRETIQIEGACVHLTDTAGLRESNDIVEREGVRRSMEAAGASGIVLFVLDGSREIDDMDRAAWAQVDALCVPVICLVNKADLPQKLDDADCRSLVGNAELLHVSAATGEGVDELLKKLYKRTCADVLQQETILISDLRQKEHLERAAEAASSAADLLEAGGDEILACDDLRAACHEIGCITGEFADAELIDRIFSKFCLGK